MLKGLTVTSLKQLTLTVNDEYKIEKCDKLKKLRPKYNGEYEIEINTNYPKWVVNQCASQLTKSAPSGFLTSIFINNVAKLTCNNKEEFDNHLTDVLKKDTYKQCFELFTYNRLNSITDFLSIFVPSFGSSALFTLILPSHAIHYTLFLSASLIVKSLIESTKKDMDFNTFSDIHTKNLSDIVNDGFYFITYNIQTTDELHCVSIIKKFNTYYLYDCNDGIYEDTNIDNIFKISTEKHNSKVEIKKIHSFKTM